MSEAVRRAYLEAMGYDVWVARAQGAEGRCLQLAPGPGKVLLVCGSAEETATRLAGDVARALGEPACWAWPGEPGPGLAEAVSERLAVVVVLFGRDTARILLGASTPEVLGSAAVVVAPSMEELATSGQARRSFWRDLGKAGALPCS